jgi:hypothetical protein
VRSRLLQRVRGLPLNARFGFGLDMLRQLEEVWCHLHHISHLKVCFCSKSRDSVLSLITLPAFAYPLIIPIFRVGDNE